MLSLAKSPLAPVLGQQGAKSTVPVVTIDGICSGAPVALIKIVVEGHGDFLAVSSVIAARLSSVAR